MVRLRQKASGGKIIGEISPGETLKSLLISFPIATIRLPYATMPNHSPIPAESTTRDSFLRLLVFCLRPRLKLVGIAFLLILLFNFVELALPKVLDLYVKSFEPSVKIELFGFDMDWIRHAEGKALILPGALLVVAILRWALAYTRAYWQGRLSQHCLMAVRRRIYDRAQRFNFDYHDRRHSGTLIANLVEDVRFTTVFFENSLFVLVETVICIAFIHCFIFVHCWQAGLACMLCMSLACLFATRLWRHNLPLFQATKENFARMVSAFTENMEGQLVVRAYGRREAQEKSFAKVVKELQDSALREVHWQILSHQIIGWGACICFAAAISAYLWACRSAQIDPAGSTILMITSALIIHLAKARQFMGGMDNLMRFLVTARRLDDFFRDQRDEYEDPAAQSLPVLAMNELRFEQVSFAYGERDPVVRELSFTLRHGRILGVIGGTGAGKSTLAQLAAGFYTPMSGKVSIDGKGLSDYHRIQLRRSIAIVFQETFLFAGSLADNIAFGNPGAKPEEIAEAARLACAEEFISQLPDGYGAEIGEKGVSLSGGQRQRLGIARALLRRPRLLILDACTSALDNRTEAKILSNLRQLQGVTVLLITHRAEALELADEVVVLDDGLLVEHGSPAELKSRTGSRFRSILGHHGTI